jgi:hypothetical protein
MRYDIAKNDDGPLRRTKAKKGDSQQSTSQQSSNTRPGGEVVLLNDEDALPKHHPGADERLSNIEAHLAVRYGQYFRCRLYPSIFKLHETLYHSSISTPNTLVTTQVPRGPHH